MPEGGYTKCFHYLKEGAPKVLLCLEVGHKKAVDPQFSYFVPPLPIINDQSLIGPMNDDNEVENACRPM